MKTSTVLLALGAVALVGGGVWFAVAHSRAVTSACATLAPPVQQAAHAPAPTIAAQVGQWTSLVGGLASQASSLGLFG